MKSGKSSSLTKKIAVISSLPALLAVSYFFNPGSLQGTPICVFKITLGLPCLGCGLTRAFSSMADLHFSAAIQHHFLSPVILLFFFLWYGASLYRLFREWASPPWWRTAVTTLVVSMLVLWSGRMVMFFSSEHGYNSLLKQNLIMRIVRMDWSNTWEPWEENSHPPLDNK
jgi:hypothetical protein